MPIKRNKEVKEKEFDEKLLDDETLDNIAKKKETKEPNKSKLSPKTKYILEFSVAAILVFLLGLLIIALMNLGIYGRFEL